MIAGFFGLRWSSSGKGNILFPAAIKRGRASNNQLSVVKSNGRLVDDPGGYVEADGQRQPLDPRRRCRLSNVLLTLSHADGGGLALWARRRSGYGRATDHRRAGRAPAGSCQTDS